MTGLLVFPVNAEEEQSEAVKDLYENLQTRMGMLERQLEEVRRDQLNYEIERDLLKETFSSNLQTVNVVVTIILATFAILGFLGVRSIGHTRQEFRDELHQVRELRSRSESRLSEIESHQKLAQSRLDEVAELNTEQDQRLKLLEIQERAAALQSAGEYARALEYIAIGLGSDSDNEALLELKRRSLGSLKRTVEWASVLEHLLTLDPKNGSAGPDLCEFHLLQGHRDQYETRPDQASNQVRGGAPKL